MCFGDGGEGGNKGSRNDRSLIIFSCSSVVMV